MANANVFDRVILPKLTRCTGLNCPTCRGIDIRTRTYPSELRRNAVVEERWCVNCRRMISDEEIPTPVHTPLRREYEEAA